MTTSIGYALGIGSGLDIKALVDGLAEASKAPKAALLAKREEANAAKVSRLAEISYAIDFFASSMSSLLSGGTLFSQPSVSDPTIFGATALAGARLGDLTAEMEVLQLAKTQTLESGHLANKSAPVGQGTLTLHTANGAFDVVIDESNDSLEGLAKAINDAKAGVTASIVTDANGARLVLKGGSGEAQAFTLSVPDGTNSGLERFAFGPAMTGGMTLAQAAQDAIIRLDGVEVHRGSNSFSDLIEGVKIDLARAAPGSIVTIGVTRPSAAIEQAVKDFVEIYNEMMNIIAQATASGEPGSLRNDLGVRELQRELAKIPSMQLVSQGDGPRTLAEIGVRTNRDGTLSLNASQLQAKLAEDPHGVEALFNPSQHSSDPNILIKSAMGRVKPGVYTVTDLVSAGDGTQATGKIDGQTAISSGSHIVAPSSSKAVGLILEVGAAASSVTITIDPGLAGALQVLRDGLRARSGPFAATQDRLSSESKEIAKDREALERRSETYYNQLLSSFTAMERQVSAFKATQSYLEQQVKIWTNDRR
jgi:flagellar hook-associated protein 2